MITELKAGREMDAMIAEKVFGWLWHDVRPGKRLFARPGVRYELWPDSTILNHSIPEYSTDISAAWEVVNHWKGGNRGFSCWWGDGDGWVVEFWETGNDMGDVWPVTKDQTEVRGRPLPEAICLAALKAVGA